jgi:hypothetical protein
LLPAGNFKHEDQDVPDQTKRQKIRLPERLEEKRPRKLLAIDGGGIRGVLSLQILAEIESLLREETSNSDYRLADYFDMWRGPAPVQSSPREFP